jgi:hypothetical protein
MLLLTEQLIPAVTMGTERSSSAGSMSSASAEAQERGADAEKKQEKYAAEATSSEPANTFASVNAQQALKTVEKQMDFLNYFIFGLVTFVVITFLIEIYAMNLNYIKDKELYLHYNDSYQRYVDENSKLKDEINNEKIDINNLKSQFQSELDLLKARNPRLK